jgi:FkbM family methyltransferase
MILYDLGARLGEAISHFDLSKYSKVVGYEANPDVTGVPAGYTEWVPAAAWTHDGTISFVVGSDLSDCSGVEGYNCVYSRQITSRTIEVPCVDFPKVVSENGPCDIKMDVEGAEWVLLPALIPFAKLITNLYIEWHPGEKGNQQTASDLSSVFKKEGVTIHPWF